MTQAASKITTTYQSSEIEVESTKSQGRVLRNLIFHALNIGSTFLLLSVGSILTARFLGTERMGQYGLLTTFSTTIINVGTLGLVDAASRFVAQYIAEGNRKLLLGFVRFGIMFELALSLLAAVLISSFALPLSQTFKVNGQESYFVLTALVAAPAMLASMFTSILAGLQRYDLIAIVKIATSLPLLALTVVVLMLQWNITGLLVINLLVNFVTLVAFVVLVMRLLPLFEKGSFSRQELWRTAKFSFSMMMLTLLNMVVWQRSEVFFLSTFRSSHEVGLYVIPFSLSAIFANLITNVLHVLIPTLADMIGRGDLPGIARLFRTQARITTVIAVPVAFGGIFLASQLLDTIYGGEYAGGTVALRILFLATLAGTVAAGASYTIISTAPNGWIFLGVMLGLGTLSIGLDFLIIPQYGTVGAAICNSSVQLLAPFVYDQVLRRLHGFGFPGRNIAGIVGLGLACLVLSFGFKLAVGGWLGPIGGAVLFAVVYLGGLVWFKLIYREDLSLFLKIVRRLPGKVRRPLESGFTRAESRLEADPPVDSGKLKYENLRVKSIHEH